MTTTQRLRLRQVVAGAIGTGAGVAFSLLIGCYSG
jgi:hypothetical protein